MVKPMTPTERAEEILDDHWGICEGRDILEKTIAAALTAARAEGWAEAIKRLDGIQKEAHWLGFRECRRKAEKIARAQKHIPPFDWDSSLEDKLAIYSNRTCEIIAESIKTLAPEEK